MADPRATAPVEPPLVDWFSQFIERHQEGCGSDTEALIACLDRVRDSHRAQPQAREDAQPVALPTDEGGCVTKRFVIFTTPGKVPEKKGGWLKGEHLIDFLRDVMLHDNWKPGFRATVLELTWDNDLWASSATEYLSMHDHALGPRRARKAWLEARAKHERIYKTAPTMKLGDEIASYHKATAIIPSTDPDAAAADVGTASEPH